PGAVAAGFTATVAWGDGTSSAGSVAATADGRFAVSAGHTYAHAGTFTLTVVAGDTATARAVAMVDVPVDDVPLSATPAAAELGATEGQSFSAALATFTDANPAGTLADYTAVIDWGDGATSAGTLTDLGGGVFGVAGGHTYAAAGRYV